MARKPNNSTANADNMRLTIEAMLGAALDTKSLLAGVHSSQLERLIAQAKAGGFPDNMSEEVYKTVHATVKSEATEGRYGNQGADRMVSIVAGVILGVSHGIEVAVSDTKAQDYATRVRSILKDTRVLAETPEARVARKAKEAAKKAGKPTRAKGAGRKPGEVTTQKLLEAAMLLCGKDAITAKLAVSTLTTTEGRAAFKAAFSPKEEPKPEVPAAGAPDIAAIVAAVMASLPKS